MGGIDIEGCLQPPFCILCNLLWPGAMFCNCCAGEGLVAEREDAPAVLAGLLYQQLEATEAKQADLLQTSKCLIFLAPHLYSLDEQHGRLPSQRASADKKDEGECLPKLKQHARTASLLCVIWCLLDLDISYAL